MKKILLVFSILLLCSFLFANETKTIVDVQGFGVTRNEAIQNALIEAIKQTKGVSIDSQKSFAKDIAQVSVSDNGSNSRNVGVSSLSMSQVKEATKGIIDQYRILDEKKLGAHEYQVDLSVKILGYKAPGLSHKSRRKIAVMPFYSSDKYFKLNNKTYKSSKVSDMLTQTLTNNMTQARKFAVLDRSYTRDMASEMNLLSSEKVSLSQKVKLGQRLGADYLLVGTIQNASFYNKTSRNMSLGTTTNKNIVELIVDYRIVVVGTSQIKWSDTVKASIDVSGTGVSYKMLLQNSLEKVSQEITISLLENIYPPRIIDISRIGNIVLNQGGNSFKIGMKFDVMKLGKKMIDPYTKEPLGRLEEKVAELEITRVTPKLSYAKVVDGTLGLISKNDICRRKQNGSAFSGSEIIEDNKDWRGAGNVVVEDGGGVHLPFD